jgi:hypothetical protein
VTTPWHTRARNELEAPRATSRLIERFTRALDPPPARRA